MGQDYGKWGTLVPVYQPVFVPPGWVFWERQRVELLAILAIFARLMLVSFRLVPDMGRGLNVYDSRSLR